MQEKFVKIFQDFKMAETIPLSEREDCVYHTTNLTSNLMISNTCEARCPARSARSHPHDSWTVTRSGFKMAAPAYCL